MSGIEVGQTVTIRVDGMEMLGKVTAVKPDGTVEASLIPMPARHCSAPGHPDHYSMQPSDWGDFDTPDGGCTKCGIYPTRKP